MSSDVQVWERRVSAKEGRDEIFFGIYQPLFFCHGNMWTERKFNNRDGIFHLL